jgi:hypothetical protein
MSQVQSSTMCPLGQMSCTTYQWYWISWDDSGQNVMLYLAEFFSPYPIRAVGAGSNNRDTLNTIIIPGYYNASQLFSPLLKCQLYWITSGGEGCATIIYVRLLIKPYKFINDSLIKNLEKFTPRQISASDEIEDKFRVVNIEYRNRHR